MLVPSDPARAFGRSPFLTPWVTRALKHRVKRSFECVRYCGKLPQIERGRGILLYATHPSWWDPAIFALLQDHFFTDRPGFGPIDAAAVKRYPFLQKAGFLPLDARSHGSIRSFLTASQQILRSGGTFWITGQGEFSDTRLRPIRLRPGLAHIAARSPGTAIIPVALDYSFGSENRPIVSVKFGETIYPTGHSIAELNQHLSKALESTADALTRLVVARQDTAFTILLRGSVGMGGLYGKIQHFSAFLKRRPYDPNHADR